MNNDPWEGDIPGRYQPGEVKKGKVTKLTNFGVFVELEPGLEGLLHISELADHKVESPEDVVKVGDEIEVKVLRVDAADRKIGLSRKQIGKAEEEGDGSAGRRQEAGWAAAGPGAARRHRGGRRSAVQHAGKPHGRSGESGRSQAGGDRRQRLSAAPGGRGLDQLVAVVPFPGFTSTFTRGFITVAPGAPDADSFLFPEPGGRSQ